MVADALSHPVVWLHLLVPALKVKIFRFSPCSGFSFSSSLLQCFSDLGSVNPLFQPCSAPGTVFRNSGSSFKICAQGATGPIPVLVLFDLSTGVPRPLVPVSLLVPPASWSVSPWSLSFLQVNLSTFCLEKFVHRCPPMDLFLLSMSDKQDPNPYPFQCSTNHYSQ